MKTFSFDVDKIDLIILSFDECFLFSDISDEKKMCVFPLTYLPIFLYFVPFLNPLQLYRNIVEGISCKIIYHEIEKKYALVVLQR